MTDLLRTFAPMGIASKDKNKMTAPNEKAGAAAPEVPAIDAGPASELSLGVTRVSCGCHAIAVVDDHGTLFAIADLCLRCSQPLSEGTSKDGRLTCAHCGWQYDLARGCVAAVPELRVETHRVRVASGNVYIDPYPRVAPGRLG